MAKRKGWDDLSPAYRKRLSNKGISKRSYTQGASIKSARGHKTTHEHGGYRKKAIQLGIDEYAPIFDDLSVKGKEELSKAFLDGFMSKGKGDIRNPKRKRGERIRRGASDNQIKARQRFQYLMDQLEEPLGASFWQRFKVEYMATFS